MIQLTRSENRPTSPAKAEEIHEKQGRLVCGGCLLLASLLAQSSPIINYGLPAHHHLAYQNGSMRVSDACVSPGDSSVMHRYDQDTFAIATGG